MKCSKKLVKDMFCHVILRISFSVLFCFKIDRVFFLNEPFLESDSRDQF